MVVDQVSTWIRSSISNEFVLNRYGSGLAHLVPLVKYLHVALR